MTRKIAVTLTLALLAGLVPGAATSAEPSQSSAPMQAHPNDPRNPRPTDVSTLVRNDDGIAVEIRTSNLDPGTYTVWWVIFNHPEYCAAAPCMGSDLPGNGGDPLIEASVLFADGGFVGPNGKGRFASGLAVGQTKDALFGPGLVAPHGAEVHLLVRTHGAPLLDALHAQITTPGGGCPPNTCVDQQFAVHLP